MVYRIIFNQFIFWCNHLPAGSNSDNSKSFKDSFVSNLNYIARMFLKTYQGALPSIFPLLITEKQIYAALRGLFIDELCTLSLNKHLYFYTICILEINQT